MNPRESAAERRSPRTVTNADVETLLRANSNASRMSPPPQLRRQTLTALRKAAHNCEVPTFLDRWRASFSATASLASVMLLLALVASMVRLNRLPTHESAVPRATPWSALAQVTAPLGEELRRPMPNPLVREARLIMQDARQTVTHLQRQLPFRPRFNQPTPDSNIDATVPAKDGA